MVKGSQEDSQIQNDWCHRTILNGLLGSLRHPHSTEGPWRDSWVTLRTWSYSACRPKAENQTMGFWRVFHGFLMGFLWVFHGFLMGFWWVFQTLFRCQDRLARERKMTSATEVENWDDDDFGPKNNDTSGKKMNIRTFRQHCHVSATFVKAFGSCIRQAKLAKLATRPGLHCFICDSVHSFFTQFSHLAMPFSTIKYYLAIQQSVKHYLALFSYLFSHWWLPFVSLFDWVSVMCIADIDDIVDVHHWCETSRTNKIRDQGEEVEECLCFAIFIHNWYLIDPLSGLVNWLRSAPARTGNSGSSESRLERGAVAAWTSACSQVVLSWCDLCWGISARSDKFW